MGGACREAIYVTPNYCSHVSQLKKNTWFSPFCLIFSVGRQIADPVLNGLEPICCGRQKCSCWWWPLVNTVTRTRLCVCVWMDGRIISQGWAPQGLTWPIQGRWEGGGDATVASTTLPGLPFPNVSTPKNLLKCPSVNDKNFPQCCELHDPWMICQNL